MNEFYSDQQILKKMNSKDIKRQDTIWGKFTLYGSTFNFCFRILTSQLLY